MRNVSRSSHSSAVWRHPAQRPGEQFAGGVQFPRFDAFRVIGAVPIRDHTDAVLPEAHRQPGPDPVPALLDRGGLQAMPDHFQVDAALIVLHRDRAQPAEDLVVQGFESGGTSSSELSPPATALARRFWTLLAGVPPRFVFQEPGLGEGLGDAPEIEGNGRGRCATRRSAVQPRGTDARTNGGAGSTRSRMPGGSTRSG